MKRIKAAKMGTICVPTEETDLTVDMKAIEEARANKLHVIEGALSIERQLAHIIAHYFFGSSHERKLAFQSLVLESDWCSFAAKRKLVNYIINEQALLKGNDKSNFDKLLRKVMSYRNAFTHGTLRSESQKIYLSFFQGKPMKVELTDNYLTQVEKVLREACIESLDIVSKISGGESC